MHRTADQESSSRGACLPAGEPMLASDGVCFSKNAGVCQFRVWVLAWRHSDFAPRGAFFVLTQVPPRGSFVGRQDEMPPGSAASSLIAHAQWFWLR